MFFRESIILKIFFNSPERKSKQITSTLFQTIINKDLSSIHKSPDEKYSNLFNTFSVQNKTNRKLTIYSDYTNSAHEILFQ